MQHPSLKLLKMFVPLFLIIKDGHIRSKELILTLEAECYYYISPIIPPFGEVKYPPGFGA